MKTKILRCLAALGLVGGILAMSAVPASATMSPGNGQPIQTGFLWSGTGWYDQVHCNLYFTQGNSGGRAYAVISRPTASDCPISVPRLYDCYLPGDPTSNPHCWTMVRISYAMINGSPGGATWGYLPVSGLNQAWAVGPPGSVLLSSQIFEQYYGYDCNGAWQPPCDPLLAHNAYNMAIAVAFYSGI